MSQESNEDYYQEPKNCKRKRVVLDLQKKLRILDRLENGEKQIVLAAEYGVGKSTISDLKAKKEKLLEFTSQCADFQLQRSTMRGCTEFDKRLYRWFLEERLKNGNFPTGPDLHKEALSLHQQMYPGNSSFRASNGWLHRFRLRHGLHKNLSEDDIARALQAEIDTCLTGETALSFIKTEPEDPYLEAPDIVDKFGDYSTVLNSDTDLTQRNPKKIQPGEENLYEIVPKTEKADGLTSNKPFVTSTENPNTIIKSLKKPTTAVDSNLSNDILGSDVGSIFGSLTSTSNEYYNINKTTNVCLTEVSSSNTEISNIQTKNECTVSSSIEDDVEKNSEQNLDNSSTEINTDSKNVLNIPKATEILEMCGKIRLFLLTKNIHNKSIAIESVSKLENVIAEVLCVHGDI